MQIIYYKDAVGNFGDDLNEVMWPRLLPEDVRSAPGTVLVGIGSLLDQARFRGVETAGKRVFGPSHHFVGEQVRTACPMRDSEG